MFVPKKIAIIILWFKHKVYTINIYLKLTFILNDITQKKMC